MALILRKIRGFMEKENYDFDRPDIDLFNFHPQLCFFYMINGIFFNNRNSILRFFIPTLCSMAVFVGLGFELMFIHHGIDIKDYPFAAESFCYIMLLVTVPNLYTSVLMRRDLIIEQIDLINGDFLYIRNLGPRHRDSFTKGQLKIWRWCWTWLGLCFGAAFVYVLNGFGMLLYHTFFVTLDENSVRPLIFPFWLPHDDPYRTPNYEVFLFFEIWLIFIINQSFGAYIYIQFHILLHYINLIDMIILDIEVIFEGLDESVVELPMHDPRRMEVRGILNGRLKRIVYWHSAVFKSIDMLSSVYGPTLAYQVGFSAIIICLVAYQVVDALSIADTCWNCGWERTDLGRMVCTDFLIIMLRAQKTLTIKFTGLPSLTLETFSSISSTAYSYFNMLRQSTKK
ncbi:7tm odorant receptor domain-containing protein [Phthorimaea operculella]|nr:7tm odorant receptor domain-containing protein [Phthorimaea operculella]